MSNPTLFTIVGEYDNGETFVDWSSCDVKTTSQAAEICLAERPGPVNIIAIFPGHLEDLWERR